MTIEPLPIPVDKDNPNNFNPHGRNYSYKYIDHLYNTYNTKDINIIESDLYMRACATLMFQLLRGKAKERLDSAKLVYSKGKPNVNVNLSFIFNSQYGDIEQMYTHIKSMQAIDITKQAEGLHNASYQTKESLHSDKTECQKLLPSPKTVDVDDNDSLSRRKVTVPINGGKKRGWPKGRARGRKVRL